MRPPFEYSFVRRWIHRHDFEMTGVVVQLDVFIVFTHLSRYTACKFLEMSCQFADGI